MAIHFRRYSLATWNFSLLTISNDGVRNRMAEARTSALKLIDEQVQQNIRVFESVLLNDIPSGPGAEPSEPIQGGGESPGQSE